MSTTSASLTHASPFSDAALVKLHQRFPSTSNAVSECGSSSSSGEDSGTVSECGSVFTLFAPHCFTVDVDSVVLRQKLAEGSYGVVYTGTYNGQDVAVKIEQLGVEVEEQANVLTELTVLQSLQSLQHENLVRYSGAGKIMKSTTEAKVMILMEICENGALRERLFDTELSWSLLTRLALDIALALQCLHSHHLVHRDVKSTNILISSEWRAKLCDFSFAVHEQCGAGDEYVYGTAEFMAPEVALSEPFGVAADIFSFGIVLCEMICKCEPSSEFLHRQARDFFALDFAELQEAVPHDCPESLEALALQCCQTEPSSRPSASECIEWLQSIVEELEGDNDAINDNLPDPLNDIAVPLGLMAVQREGSVKYPKSPVPSLHSRSTCTRDTQSHSHSVDKGEIPNGVLEMFQEMNRRISFLEVQVQELRTENGSLTKELTAMQHDYMDRYQAAEQQRAVSALYGSSSSSSMDSIDQMPRNYQSRILHPGSPVPPSPVGRQSLHSSALNKVVVSGVFSRGGSNDDEDGDSGDGTLLASKVAALEKCVEKLTTSIVHLDSSVPQESGEAIADVEVEVEGVGNVDNDREESCVTEETNLQEQVSSTNNLPEVIPDDEEEASSLRDVARPRPRSATEEENNLDVVMQTFLQVVGQCSSTKQHSRRVLSAIDHERPSPRSISVQPTTVPEVVPSKKGNSPIKDNCSPPSLSMSVKPTKPAKQKSFLSQAFSPSNNKKPTQATPVSHKKTSAQAKRSPKGAYHTPTEFQQGVDEGGDNVWRDIPSHAQQHDDTKTVHRSEGKGGRVNLAQDLAQDQSDEQNLQGERIYTEQDVADMLSARLDEHPSFSSPPHVEWNYENHMSPDGAPPRRQSGGGRTRTHSHEMMQLTPEELKARNFFKGDHLYHYVFGREGSNRNSSSKMGNTHEPSRVRNPRRYTTGADRKGGNVSSANGYIGRDTSGGGSGVAEAQQRNNSRAVSTLMGGGGGHSGATPTITRKNSSPLPLKDYLINGPRPRTTSRNNIF